VTDRDDMTNADEIAEYDRADEFALDAADDARYAEQADADRASEEEPW
jgi:hypothetical protein